jgi:hypothetical protein
LGRRERLFGSGGPLLPPPLFDVKVHGSAWYVDLCSQGAGLRASCIAPLRLGCIHVFLLHCFDCSTDSTVGGCFDAWARAHTAAFGVQQLLPLTSREFAAEAQWLYDQLQPFDVFMHSVPSSAPPAV